MDNMIFQASQEKYEWDENIWILIYNCIKT